MPQYFKGTSNVLLARDLGLVPIGTMAHEYLQTFQALGVRLRDFQKAALEDWVQEYRGDLGIALTDVVGMDAFLADFDLYFAKLFDGLRHDSGDPVVWGEKALAHYAKLRIDAHTKRLVFSDGLDFEKALALYRHFADRTQLGFGIGTNLTNDVGLTHAEHRDEADAAATASRWPSCPTARARRCATTRPSSPTCARCSTCRPESCRRPPPGGSRSGARLAADRYRG